MLQMYSYIIYVYTTHIVLRKFTQRVVMATATTCTVFDNKHCTVQLCFKVPNTTYKTYQKRESS